MARSRFVPQDPVSVGDSVDDSGRIRGPDEVALLVVLDYEAPNATRRWPHRPHAYNSKAPVKPMPVGNTS
ncbi:hypothetical protein [Salinisphaera sp.]|uniref:hypothetical protein n=1 Tax=Salinisphaera sp. TaxID=1914330 RepID=UPI0025D6F426|nr:hypothetical protein [Salinisphaera sp.]